jgi:hypothetical protein
MQVAQMSSSENIHAASESNPLEGRKQKAQGILSEILRKLDAIDSWPHFSPLQKDLLKRVTTKTKEILSSALQELPTKTTEAEINRLLEETDCKLSGTNIPPCNLPANTKSQLSAILEALSEPLKTFRNSNAQFVVMTRIATLFRELAALRRMLKSAGLNQPLTETNQFAIRNKIDALSNAINSEKAAVRTSLSGTALEKVEAFYEQCITMLSQMRETGTTARINQNAYNSLEHSSLHALVDRLFESLRVSSEQRIFLQNLLTNVVSKVASR